MKKQKRTLMLTLLMIFLVSMSVQVSATESSVTFDNNKIIVVEPGSTYSNSDLFDNFKGVMPGDYLEEEITIVNEYPEFDGIDVYMRAILPEALESGKDTNTMHEFLSKLSMKVFNGTELIYDASPDLLDGLSENVYLGSLKNGESLKLNVQLYVPLDLDNKYQDQIGEVSWLFTVQDFEEQAGEVPSEKPQPPEKENDRKPIATYIIDNSIYYMGVAVSGVLLILILLKKSRSVKDNDTI